MQVWEPEPEPEPEDATVALAIEVEISQRRYNPPLWHCGVTERVWTDGLTMQGREQKLHRLQRIPRERDNVSALLEGFLEEVAFESFQDFLGSLSPFCKPGGIP